MFAKCSQFFPGFRQFFLVFRFAQTCWELFGCVQIPRTTDTKKALQLAAVRGGYYTPGQAFSATGRDIPFLRIAFGFPTIDHIRDGIPILAECIKKAQDGNKHLAA